jgi:hypothetical protein
MLSVQIMTELMSVDAAPRARPASDKIAAAAIVEENCDSILDVVDVNDNDE